MQWWKDRQLWLAAVVGMLARIVPMVVWMTDWPCVRDECTYLRLAHRLAEGQGMTVSNGWLWAPGYPFLVAIHEVVFGHGAAIRGTQVIVAGLLCMAIFRLAQQQGGRRAGLVAVWLYALSPTQIFFSQSLWSECLYSGLLICGLLLLSKVRQHHQSSDSASKLWAGSLGVVIGACMMFRGVAMYMSPLFAVAMLWGRFRSAAAWSSVVIMIVAATLTVAPYSAYATKKFDDIVITDRTLGQMMWLGNNDCQPITFDWGNGTLTHREMRRHTKNGRRPCGDASDGLARERCQTQAGFEWILTNKSEFLRRMPMRVAQLVNPHSFVTRHLREGRWRGLPQIVDEGIIIWNVVWSLMVMLGGVVGLCGRGRSARGALVGGLLLYHVGVIACLAGMTRYRVPLEPLLMLYCAQFIGDPRATISEILNQRWRLVASITTMVIFLPLILWYLPSGWSVWRAW